MASQSVFDYYAHTGLMTDPREYASHFTGLPQDVTALRDIVQGLLVHVFWAERYGLKLPDERKQEAGFRTVPQQMKRLLELDAAPLATPRPLEKRLVGNCRNFSVLLCALLQSTGIPARARCGFGVYFGIPNHYEDHWVAEYWNGERWVLVDAQLDAFQRTALGIQFDPLDVPRDQFITGGKAWLLCRNGEANPDQFGIFDLHGWAFVRGNLVRDFLALNQIEILPWEGWGFMADNDQDAAASEVELADRIAHLTLGGNDTFADIRALYENDSRLHVPPGYQP